MSEENVEIVRRTFDEAGRRGVPTAKYFDPEVEFREDPRLPEAGLYRGVEAVIDYWEQFVETFDEFIFEAEDFIDLGDGRVLGLLVITTRGRGSSARVTMRIGWIYTVRDGLIARVEAFAERAEALEAAGLR